MIADLSLSLRELLERSAAQLPGLDVARIVFDRPAETFNPGQPTLSLYLYDIRQNLELRSNENLVNWRNGQAQISRPPLRVACTYLITAWPGTAETGDESTIREQRLLSQALLVLSRHPHIPAEYLLGQLAGQEPALPMITARAEGLPNPAEFWNSLANRLRPSLTVTVTLSMSLGGAVTAHPVKTAELIVKDGVRKDSDRFQIGGHVYAADRSTVAKARVVLAARALSSRTDAEGRYLLGPIEAGTYVLTVHAGANRRDISIDVPAPAGRNYDLQLT